MAQHPPRDNGLLMPAHFGSPFEDDTSIELNQIRIATFGHGGPCKGRRGTHLVIQL